MGIGDCFLRGKTAVDEYDYSPPSSAETRMRGTRLPLPYYVFMARPLIKKRDNFTIARNNVFFSTLACMCTYFRKEILTEKRFWDYYPDAFATSSVRFWEWHASFSTESQLCHISKHARKFMDVFKLVPPDFSHFIT
jgi:hypothetical protein